MLENIINELPESPNSRIIVTTRFHAVATTRRAEEIDIRNVKGLDYTQSKILFEQALSDSQGRKDVNKLVQADRTTTIPTKEGDLIHKISSVRMASLYHNVLTP